MSVNNVHTRWARDSASRLPRVCIPDSPSICFRFVYFSPSRRFLLICFVFNVFNLDDLRYSTKFFVQYQCRILPYLDHFSSLVPFKALKIFFRTFPISPNLPPSSLSRFFLLILPFSLIFSFTVAPTSSLRATFRTRSSWISRLCLALFLVPNLDQLPDHPDAGTQQTLFPSISLAPSQQLFHLNFALGSYLDTVTNIILLVSLFVHGASAREYFLTATLL